MLVQQQILPLSNYSDLYDLIIPENNILRRLNELIDFSFVYEELSNKYCHNNGRNAESPIRMFKYLLLKSIYNISDVDVVERSRVDMSFKYFLDISPESDVINPSSLTKFRKLRLKDTDLLNLLIRKTVAIAVDKGIIKSKSIIVDATHTTSRSNPLSPVEVLKERAKLLRKAVYHLDEDYKGKLPQKNEDDNLECELEYCLNLANTLLKDVSISSIPAIKEKINLLQETVEDTQDHYTLSKDKDARTGHKSEESSFFGYKTHLALTEERIITAAVVTSGEKPDGLQLPTLIEQSKKNGIDIDTVIGDGAYSGKNNLIHAKKNAIKIVAKLTPSVSKGTRKKEDKFEFNKDAGMFVCPAGHMAIRRAKQGTKNIGKNQAYVYYFDIEKCNTCSLKQGCYKKGAKSKTYAVKIKSSEHTEQINFQETEYFKDKSKHRYKVEAKNGELKNTHGFSRASSYGLTNMEMQAAMAIFAVNLKRILKLV
jgi:transposase